MCFVIDPTITKRRAKYAYKVVERHGKALRSLFFRTRRDWSEKGVHRASKGPSSVHGNGFKAHHGIYVFTSNGAAESACSQTWAVLIRVRVDPADFLHMSKCGTMATYRKVTVE